ncbi:MAG: hypothetical protein NC341_03270 [Blautia sp.]|nr:hypothetical protein [Blautia sp.]MCM1200639.1 hypothetical protein [Bacteroides fragilis]
MEYFIFAGAMLLLIVIIMLKGYWDGRQEQKKFVTKLHERYGAAVEREYGPEELERHIAMYYRKHKEAHQIDDITWHDLHLNEVYRKINYSHSAAGDEYLYYRLRTPVQDREALERGEKHILYFMEHEKERIALQQQFARLGRMRKYSLYEYLDYLDTLGNRNSIRYYLAVVLALIGISMMFYSVPVGLCALLLILCRNMIFYYKEQKEIEPYITSFHYISRLMESAELIAKEAIDEIAPEREQLRSCCKAMEGFRRNSFIILSGGRSGMGSAGSNPLELLFDYVRMIFYLDLIKFNQMLHMVQEHLSDIDRMVTVIGELETAVVIGEYRASLKGDYCVPVFLSEKDHGVSLKLEQLYHPLLNDPVKNDIEVKKGILLTGSNASGKSTFLRAVALNAVLAQTIHTCMAKSHRGGMFYIYSSMSLQDDLESGDSYYMVEVKSIRRILEKVKEAEKDKKQVLCFVDEVLRGTNTVERIAASTQILKALAGKNALCFAATHDLELTKLLNGIYDNYHFEEEIADEDIFFPYRLQKGPAVSRNAIALLKVLGYDETLVEDAEAMAEDFLNTGEWKE